MLAKSFVLMNRSLRIDDKLLRLHLLRLGIVAIVGFCLFLAHVSSAVVGAAGLNFFSQIIWTTLLFSTLAGATLFATCVTEEKEEQTLGLLTLANIRPLALIFGKFVPRLVTALMIITVVFPFTLLAITLGGVTWSQVWAAYWMLFAHVVFMGSVGLFFSVVCRNSGWAITFSVLALLAFFAIPPLASSFLSTAVSNGFTSAAPIRDAAGWMRDASAFVRTNEILSTGFNEGAFGTQVVSNLSAAGVICLLSWLLFLPFNKGLEASVEQVSVLDRGIRFNKQSRRAWRQAIIWKDFYQVAGGPTWWAIRVAALLPIAMVTGFTANDFALDWDLLEATGVALMGLTLFGAFPVESTIIAARLYRREIKEGTWPILAGLPLSIAHISYAKAAGGLLGLVPAAALFVFGGALAPSRVADWLIGSAGEGPALIVAVGYYLVLFAIFLHLTTLFSILVNAWAGVLLALLTFWLGGCFMGPIMFLPMMIISSSTAGMEDVAAIIIMLVYGTAILGICFGLQALIAQQLRSIAGRG
ncbi:MAG: hypothetical protein DWQ34_14755 [Planctomycetota bacterium]|nr:MAG: hypothetical protein DWQ29_16855 [Planctomycetota bacterium]REJ91538.1 MAG: hypothetical protein DWQ34_14755 [Planctomycetota bacterium]REK20529.1 MAG: hypothetical protein DWQ41_24880 [Planctomycetota bacterium]REK28283.1 MAG: hypothetical protein DWQ45_24790 [Planctomycetota bacterium]